MVARGFLVLKDDEVFLTPKFLLMKKLFFTRQRFIPPVIRAGVLILSLSFLTVTAQTLPATYG